MTGYKTLPITASMFPTPKQTFIDDFLANVNDEFYVASDVWTILEETTRGLGVCDKSIDARVTKLINSTIGANLGDDYKRLLFNGVHDVPLASYFYFDNNYWITINTENIKSISSSCSVKRCNNTLRWMGSDGSVYSYPCSIGYEIHSDMDLYPEKCISIECSINWIGCQWFRWYRRT